MTPDEGRVAAPQAVALGRGEVVAALRDVWREGEWISAGWQSDYERALEGSGMRDAAEKIAARLGIDEAELRAEPPQLERLIGVEQPFMAVATEHGEIVCLGAAEHDGEATRDDA
ncbi:hypothetical protein [Sorangium sp. So ce693]|uniref:hypothetical protein n=1 Tax=Sorangium sp. So ce693 TaxID=3133318 RepID=UPI003F5E88FC